jgi:hypothetical protein
MAAYIEAIATAIAWIVLPGVAIAAVLDRKLGDGSRPERFFTVALAAGLSVWVIGARALDLAGGLTRGATITVTIALAVASVAATIALGRPSLHALRTREAAEVAGWAGGSTLVGATPIMWIVVAQRDALINSTPWYYWNQVRQTVAARGTPDWTYEWGRWVGFLDAYPGFTTGASVLALVSGTKTLAAAIVVTVVAMLAGGFALFLLVRMLGGGLAGAAFGVLLFFAFEVFSSKLSALRPESLGYAFALLCAALVLEYVRTGHTRVLVVLAFTFAGLAQVHGIDWLFGCGLVAAAVFAGYPLRRPPEHGRRRVRLDARRWLVRGALVAVVTLAAWGIANVALASNLSGASDLGGLPEIHQGVDPTWEFAALAQGNPGSTPPSVSDLLTNSLQRGFRGLGWPWFATVAGLALAILLARAFVGPATRARALSRRALVFLLVASAIALGASLFFSINWSTYVPRRTGFARLLQVALLLVPVGAGLALSFLPWGERPAVRRRVAAVAGVIALGFGLFITVHGQNALDGRADQRPLAVTLGALRQLGLQPDDVVLTNVYSEGIVPVTTGARGVLDGRAPYADATLLGRSNALLARARTFMQSPTTGAPLPCKGIDYVLVATDGRWSLGSPFVFATDFDGLRAREDLEFVSEAPGFQLYRVKDPAAAGDGTLDCTATDPEVTGT